MKATIKKLIACMLVISLSLSGCGNTSKKEKEECPYEDFIVVDVFDSLSNFQGIQSGWFAHLVKEKFNMELNIIAPNVAGGGDTLFEVRSAAGNLGDLIVFSNENQIMQDMVTSGLVMNMEPYLKDKQIMRFESEIRKVNESITPEGIYAVPSEISENAPTTSAECKEPVFGPYLRWDLYKELGYPRIETLEDLLPVLKQMQELEPVTEKGEKTYAFSFFRDWDANLMNAAKQPCCFYGYDESGFVLVKADSSEYQNILDSDSIYVRVLKWFFDANQMGLVDPESVTLSYEEFSEKYARGQVLYAPWPWVAQIHYNTLSRAEEGKGFMMANIEDMQIYSYGCNPDGNYKITVGVGSQAADPQRMVDFIDWLYSPEGIAANGVNTMADTAGPEGLTWEYGEDGPYLTEFGKKALLEGDADVPDEWGGGRWTEGISALNFMTVSMCEVDDRGYPYMFALWDSVRDMEDTPLEVDWKNKMQATTTMDYLTQNNKVLVSPGYGYTIPTETSEQSAIRKQCRGVIQKYSWDMIFAENEKEFYELLKKMQNEAKNLGYEEIYALDLENTINKENMKWERVIEYEREAEK